MKTTLVVCRCAGGILLATKQTGFGEGKLNAFGGKVQDGETPEAAAVRELKEETGLIAEEIHLEKVAVLYFFFAGKQRFTCHVYTLSTWQGEPSDTPEMAGFEWHSPRHLPFARMWAGDRHWLPLVLRRQRIEGLVYFNHDGTVVEDFLYQPLADA